MAGLAQQERSALCDLFGDVGPTAPTCCEGWTTADLAAHLVVRERRPDAAIGIVAGPLSFYTRKVQRDMRDHHSWDELVELVRTGPPALLRPVDEAMNTVEYFVHHEDVRRARPGWEPRTLTPELERALWGRAKTFSRFVARKLPATALFDAPGFGQIERGSGERVTVTGPPAEIVLFLFGRKGVSRLSFAGDAGAVTALQNANLGL